MIGARQENKKSCSGDTYFDDSARGADVFISAVYFRNTDLVIPGP